VMEQVRPLIRSIVLGGTVAGLVDIVAACLIYRLKPVVLLRGIASGLIGDSAASGGLSISVLGFVLQVGMSVLIAAICITVRRQFRLVKLPWVVTGIAFGVATFIVMNYVVMPLSAIGHIPHFSVANFEKNLTAMVVFGLIIGFASRSVQDAPSRRHAD
jgi:uncharacterized membrane protein YagU involved in acid resistance